MQCRIFPATFLPHIVNCRHSYTAWLTLADRGQQGFVVGQGSELNGWVLLVQDGHGVYVNNCVKLHLTSVRTELPLPIGREFSLAVEYEPIEIGLGRVTVRIDDEIAALCERMPSSPMGMSNVTEGLQVGRCWSRPIVPGAFHGDFGFEGKLRVVELRTDPGSLIRRTDYNDPGDTRP